VAFILCCVCLRLMLLWVGHRLSLWSRSPDEEQLPNLAATHGRQAAQSVLAYFVNQSGSRACHGTTLHVLALQMARARLYGPCYFLVGNDGISRLVVP